MKAIPPNAPPRAAAIGNLALSLLESDVGAGEGEAEGFAEGAGDGKAEGSAVTSRSAAAVRSYLSAR